MHLTKRQKSFLAIFFLGLIALVVDRTVLRPQGAPKAASADALQAAQSAAAWGDGLGSERTLKRSAAERLNALWPDPNTDFTQVRNPFLLPPLWFDNIRSPAGQMADPAAVFISRHTLTAVVIDGRESYALVDDQFLTPGQDLDGFQLVSIGDRSVVFERDGKRTSLELANK